MEWDEKRHRELCGFMSYVPKGENRASETWGTTTAPANPGVEMGTHHHGFYDWNAKNH